jgi:hypothetical protein
MSAHLPKIRLSWRIWRSLPRKIVSSFSMTGPVTPNAKDGGTGFGYTLIMPRRIASAVAWARSFTPSFSRIWLTQVRQTLREFRREIVYK